MVEQAVEDQQGPAGLFGVPVRLGRVEILYGAQQLFAEIAQALGLVAAERLALFGGGDGGAWLCHGEKHDSVGKDGD